MYSDLVKNKTFPPLDIPQTIVPIPIDDDYDTGVITRYFIQKANDPNGFVFEVSSELYDELTDNPFWKVADLKWRISGPKETQYRENGDVFDVSVSESNRRAIKLVYERIPTLKLYLPNLLQFYK